MGKELDKTKNQPAVTDTKEDFGQTGGRLSNFMRRVGLRSSRGVLDEETRETHSRSDLGEAWIRLKEVEKQAHEIAIEHQHLDTHLENHRVRVLSALRLDAQEIDSMAVKASVGIKKQDLETANELENIQRQVENAKEQKEIADLEAKAQMLMRRKAAQETIDRIEGGVEQEASNNAQVNCDAEVNEAREKYADSMSDAELNEEILRIKDKWKPAIDREERQNYFNEDS